MVTRHDVIVLGVGSMGAAACRALAERGVRVLGLDARAVPHADGSHHGRSRFVRLAYSEHPDYVPLLKRAHTLWHELNARTDQEIFRQTGAIFAGPADHGLVPDSRRSAATHGLAHRPLSPGDLRAEFPIFRLPAEYAGLWEPTAGYVDPENAIRALVRQARAAGAEIHPGEPVLAWDESSQRVQVRTPEGAYEGDRLVIAGGAWAGKVAGAALHAPLVVTRQVLLWTHPAEPARFALGEFPCWAVQAPDGHSYYGFPLDERQEGLKSARHWSGTPTDPDNVSRATTPADEDEARAFLRAHLPAGDGPTAAVRTCLYTNSPDGHFVIGPVGAHGRVTIACGFSGHGFKFVPVIGEVLADLATHARTDHPIGLFDPARFARASGGHGPAGR